MIQFNQVVKKYPGNEFTLGEINIEINPGEFAFLIGPSGSGKTTLIRLLIREEEPTSGRIFFDDYDITKLSRNRVYRLRRQIGVVFQDYKLINDKNVYENVAFAMEVAGRKNKEIKETVPYLLDIVGLTPRSKAFPAQLSGGEKQRVAIARAVANNPRVLIADEPTGNLDPGAAWDIVQILAKINNWGTTVIMSTHGSDIVNTLNKRVIQMAGGKVVRDDRKGRYEVTQDYESGMLQHHDYHPEKGVDLDKVEQRKGPIKVTLGRKPRMEEVEQKPHESSGLLEKLGLQHKEEQTEPELETNEPMSIEQVHVGAEIMQDADQTSVKELDLQPEVVADLQTAGYNDVEDLISAGPEKLSEEFIIDPQEVVEVSKAISEFVDEETGKKPKRSKATKAEEETEIKPKKATTKLNLTGKKKA